MKDQSTPDDSAVRDQEIEIFDEDGALSREFLRHRGYCCKNGCRNCPYGFGEKLKKSAKDSELS